MAYVKSEIADDIELLVSFVGSVSFLGNPKLEEAMAPFQKAAFRVEAWLATTRDDLV